MNESFLLAGFAHGGVDGDGLTDEAFHLRIAPGGTLFEVAAASSATLSPSAPKQGAVIAAGDTASDEYAAVEGFYFSYHHVQAYQLEPIIYTSVPSIPVKFFGKCSGEV